METESSSYVLVQFQSKLAHTRIPLPASKSISNRALILDALAGGGSDLSNLSRARDTQTMIRLLESDEKELDVLDAGTTMRFLTGYLAVQDRPRILKGSKRMHERPISILVDALRKVGAEIEYLGQDGYPPLLIHPFKAQVEKNIEVKGDISSQYLSALLMIAPSLPKGLTLIITGKIMSRPYLEMTLSLMALFGIDHSWQNNRIEILPQSYRPASLTVESDWSAASYWYSILALSPEGELFLEGLQKPSLQGDSRIAKIMTPLGVATKFNDQGARLTKTAQQTNEVALDFSDCPDLAQTVAVVCATKGIRALMTGLESLSIKETDRIKAVHNELQKFGGDLVETAPGQWVVEPVAALDELTRPVKIATYEDHRMAMAFAPLATNLPLVIEDPQVVNKSYPGFWQDLIKAGFSVH
ncbi:MAG: 3-phosphoshikimate 1-carboxyvinyltransferase [Cyclobacteriaceae bacterium]